MPERRVLRVPLFYQPTDYTCVPTCLRMLMAYYGKPMTLRLIREQLGHKEKTRGLHFCKAGSWFLERGFEVRLMEWWRNFPNRFLHLSDDEAEPEMRRWLCRAIRRGGADERLWRSILAFMHAGGVYLPRPATTKEIRCELRAGHPPIIGIDAAMLWPVRDKEQYHAVVGVDMDRRAATINDPYPGQGGRKTYPLERFLFAYHQDSAAMFVRPKGR